MHRLFKTIIFFLFYVLFSLNPLLSQIPLNQNTLPAINLRTDFSKQNTTWNWLGHFKIEKQINQNEFLSLKETFQSNLITPSNSIKQWKDEHRFKGLYYSGLNQFLWGVYINSWLLFDKQQATRNEFSNHSGALFIKYEPIKKISFLPYAGVQRAKNITKSDIGLDIGIDGSANNFEFGAYKNNLDISSNYDFFETRKNYNNRFSNKISTKFNKFTTDSLKVSYEEVSKQFYNTSGTSLIEVKLYNRSIQNNLIYALSNQNQFTFETNILSKNVSFNTNNNVSSTNRNVFLIENRVQFRHLGQLSYQLDFRTNDETLDNRETITDSRTRQSSLALKSKYFISDKSNLKFDFIYNKLQYDTPNEKNTDDRDEQRFIFDIGYTTQLSPVLTFRLNAYGFLFHQIYLFKEQSINNNWNRVLKISPQVKYKNDIFENSLSTSVIANYTVFDFENLGPKIRSFLSRKYTISDSVLVPVYKKMAIGLNARLEIEEKGNFLKKKFAQNLIQSYRVTKYNIYATQKLFRRLGYRVGYLFFSRLEWRHVPKKSKNRTITNQGPFGSIYYNVNNRISLNAYAAINFVDDSRNIKSRYSTGFLKLFYSL
ncbi:MAG: hypothetical protein D8M58_02845 [Calditrichaeota bacterium]|nr:MAG: hypothetical protein DWQ03_04235 [Calditrichota bacterium]MBL1204302.1 hypothetical protein [Calditrichota bacterium]NOG44132.1 hypothetical protein [Calditrichota bacterium]